MLTIIEYFSCPDPSAWLEKIRRCGWKAGAYLAQLLEQESFHSVLGSRSRLLLLSEGEELISFCTYAERDDIPDPALTPWAGFVYTFPEHRGKRRMGKLLEYVHALAKRDGFPCVYISTEETGLYEKYGCEFWQMMTDILGGESRVYRMPVRSADFSRVIGRSVSGVIDRPLGSAHPSFPEMVYPVNYGYVSGEMAADGEEQDVYLLGMSRPVQTFSGRVIAVLHRLNDCEDKWIVTPDGRPVPESEIRRAVEFQEQYFMGELYT